MARRWRWELLSIVAQGACSHSAVQESGGSDISLKADSLSHQLVQTHESVQVSKSFMGLAVSLVKHEV